MGYIPPFFHIGLTLASSQAQNVSEASRQLEDLQRQVDVKANVLMEMERQMSYLRQQTSSQLQERYQRNYHFNMFTPEQKSNQGG